MSDFRGSSSFAEHLAWQQRVGQETRRFNDHNRWTTPKLMKARTFGGTNFENIQNLQSEGIPSQFSKDQYQRSNYLSYDNGGSMNSKEAKSRKNLQNYTFGGMTNIRKASMYSQMGSNNFKINTNPVQSSEPGFESGRENLTGFGEKNSMQGSDFFNLQRPTKPKVTNFFDQAYGTDLRKKARERPMSCKSGYSRKSQAMERVKAYKAPNPYRNSGGYYKQEKTRKESKRFNEALSTASKRQSNSIRSKKSASRASRRSLAAGSAHKYVKQSILGALNNELEKRSQVAKNEKLMNDKRFNTIDGTIENDDKVRTNDAEYNTAVEIDVNNIDEDQINQSDLGSKFTGKSYADKLQQEIAEERNKRLELEKQIEEIKKFNESITSKLGLNIGKNGL